MSTRLQVTMRTQTILLIVCLTTACITVQGQDGSPKDVIMKKMADQERCWNEGDLSCFMVGYWESDSLMFVNKNGVIYGYQATLDRYKRTYPDKANMGKLAFEIKHLEELSEESYFMVGKYHLTREVGDLSGHFMLIWKRIDGQWLITADHSS